MQKHRERRESQKFGVVSQRLDGLLDDRVFHALRVGKESSKLDRNRSGEAFV